MADYQAQGIAAPAGAQPDDQVPVAAAAGASVARVLDAVLAKQAMQPPRDLIYFEVDKGIAKLYYKRRQ